MAETKDSSIVNSTLIRVFGSDDSNLPTPAEFASPPEAITLCLRVVEILLIGQAHGADSRAGLHCCRWAGSEDSLLVQSVPIRQLSWGPLDAPQHGKYDQQFG